MIFINKTYYNSHKNSTYKGCISLDYHDNKVMLITFLNYAISNFKLGRTFLDTYSNQIMVNKNQKQLLFDKQKRSLIRKGLLATRKIIITSNLSWLVISNQTSFSAPIAQILVQSALSFVKQYQKRLSTKELKQILITVKSLIVAIGYYIEYGFNNILNLTKQRLN